jgi:hypothetical protein
MSDIKYAHAKPGMLQKLDDEEKPVNNNEVEEKISRTKSLPKLESALARFKELSSVFLSENYSSQLSNQKVAQTFETPTSMPHLLFLGTGANRPHKHRAASAQYFIKNGKGILIDCAEGTYGQIWDHFACKEKVDDVLSKTKVIFITHFHADHCLGLFTLLKERDELLT